MQGREWGVGERETWTKNGEMGRILFNIKSFEQKKKKPYTYMYVYIL